MRDIEFRVWDSCRKMMHKSLKWVEFRISNGVLSVVNYNRSGDEQRLEVMQFTGLLDAKGNKVFEGDLLSASHVEPREVIFEDGAFRFKDDGSNQWNQSLVPFTVGRLNVVGNIYEHPYLIKGDE